MSYVSSMQKMPKFFYGWIIVAVSFLTLGLSYGTRQAFAIFLVPMLEEFGWSRASLSSAFSLHSVVALVSVPLGGALVDRFGPRVVFPLGSLIMILGLVMCAKSTTLWEFYIAFGLIVSFGRSIMSMGPNSAVLSNWFVKKRGKAMGIAAAGSGFAMLPLAPLLQYVISTRGWRAAYLVFSALILLLIPLTALLQRRTPQEMGLLPDGESDPEKYYGEPDGVAQKDRTRSGEEEEKGEEWTVLKAIGTYQFWSLFSGFFFGNLVQAVQIHQMAFLVDVGYSRMLAASALGLIATVSTLGTISFGTLSDRIGREISYTIGAGFGIVAILTLILIQDPSQPWMVYLYTVLFGLGTRGSLIPSIAADIFHGRHFGAIYGVVAIGIALGNIFAPWFGGYIFDITGSYRIAFAAAMGGIALACLFIWIAAPRKAMKIGRGV
ncbi:MAG: MFS transporter [Candidatus Tectomicrobia bacterium]|nr:MFS transporter [Candidatus Tectomicrobia bacterium]